MYGRMLIIVLDMKLQGVLQVQPPIYAFKVDSDD